MRYSKVLWVGAGREDKEQIKMRPMKSNSIIFCDTLDEAFVTLFRQEKADELVGTVIIGDFIECSPGQLVKYLLVGTVIIGDFIECSPGQLVKYLRIHNWQIPIIVYTSSRNPFSQKSALRYNDCLYLEHATDPKQPSELAFNDILEKAKELLYQIVMEQMKNAMPLEINAGGIIDARSAVIELALDFGA